MIKNGLIVSAAVLADMIKRESLLKLGCSCKPPASVHSTGYIQGGTGYSIVDVPHRRPGTGYEDTTPLAYSLPPIHQCRGYHA